MKILLLGDATEARTLRRSALASSGFRVDMASPRDIDSRLSTGKPYALILLDLAPAAALKAAIRAIRRTSAAPLLVLTPRDRLADRLEGLALGATEYLVEPCATETVLARAWALASPGSEPGTALLRLADLAIDRRRGKAFRQDIDLGLSATLFELLDVLTAHRGQVMSRERLMQSVWGPRAAALDNLVTVAILRLRRKLDDPFPLKLLHTVHGEGYVMELRHDSPAAQVSR